jgi:uncharacterized membrane protein
MIESNTLVDRMRARLEAGYWPRVHCLLIVSLSSAAAFLLSATLLAVRVDSMAVRYGLAALGGYATFLVLIHAWVQWKWSRLVPDADVDVGQLPGPGILPWPSSPRVSDASTLFSGGRSGGGGASMSVDGQGTSSVSVVPHSGGAGGGKGSGVSLDLDGDDLFWLLVALAAAFAGFLAIAYVIYVAPTLLAEAAVNGAVAGRVYHGLQKRESQHWTTDIVRRTGVAAAILVISVSAAGYALRRVAPEARSIGGVWHHIHQP